MRRWADNYAKLSPACRARLTGVWYGAWGSGDLGGGMGELCMCWVVRPAQLAACPASAAALQHVALSTPSSSSVLRALRSTLTLRPPSHRPSNPLCAVENDDRPGSFSLHDLLFLHNLTGVPLVFDFHHHKAGSACAVLLAWVGLGWVVRVQSARAICHLWLVCHPLCCNGNTCNTLHHPLCWKKRTCNTLQFCTGGLSEREAFEAAIRTWPQGVRPVCHWSESQVGGWG